MYKLHGLVIIKIYICQTCHHLVYCIVIVNIKQRFDAISILKCAELSLSHMTYDGRFAEQKYWLLLFLVYHITPCVRNVSVSETTVVDLSHIVPHTLLSSFGYN